MPQIDFLTAKYYCIAMQTVEWRLPDGPVLGRFEVPQGVIIQVEGTVQFDTSKLEKPADPEKPKHAENMKKLSSSAKRRRRKERNIEAVVKKYQESEKKSIKEQVAFESNHWASWKDEKKPEFPLHEFLIKCSRDIRNKILGYLVIKPSDMNYNFKGNAVNKAYRDRQSVFDKIKYAFKKSYNVDLKKPELKYNGPHPISLMLLDVRPLMFVNKLLFAIVNDFIKNLQIHQFIPSHWIMFSSNKTVAQCLAKGYGMDAKNMKAMTNFRETEKKILIIRRKKAKNIRRYEKRKSVIKMAMDLTKDRVFDQITENVGSTIVEHARKWQTKAGSVNRDYDDAFGFGRGRKNRQERGKNRRGMPGIPRQNHRMIIASLPFDLEVYKGWSVKDVLFYKKATEKRSPQPWDLETRSKSNIQTFMHQLREWIAERYKIKKESFYIYYVIEHSKDGDLVKFEIHI